MDYFRLVFKIALIVMAASYLSTCLEDYETDRKGRTDCQHLAIEHNVTTRYSARNGCEVQTGKSWIRAWYFLHEKIEAGASHEHRN